jgi:hypothetical protein
MGYLKRVKIVGVRFAEPRGGYLQEVAVMGLEDEKGQPILPKPDVPGAPLQVDEPTTTEGEVTLGSELVGTRATFTGGEEPINIETRWERSDDSLTWVGLTGWQEVPVLTYTTVAQDVGKYIRFNTKAVDAEGTRVESEGNAVGPMVAAPLQVVTPTKISNGSFVNPPQVYDFETIRPISAIYSGGFGPIELRYRLQENTGGGWSAIGGWTGGDPTYNVSQSAVGDNLRWQTRATDEVGQQLVSNSTATTVGTATTIGTVEITPTNSALAPAASVTLTATYTGNAANLLRIWSIRSGPGQITSPSNIGVDCEITATGQPGANITVQCDYSDPSSSDSPQSALASILIQE